MYYVYLVDSLSAQGERYVGMTTDLNQRLREHDQGKSSYHKVQPMEANHVCRVH